MSVQDDLLVADFQQCFEQMRHYDSGFRQTLEFSVTGVVAVVTACGFLVGNYHFTYPVGLAITALLFLASVGGMLLIISLVRNRFYFARVCRYVNEVRGHYLEERPAGIRNVTGMYTNPKFPPAFSPGSTQSAQLYLLTFCIGTLFAMACAAAAATRDVAAGRTAGVHWVLCGVALLLFIGVALLWALLYLRFADRIQERWMKRSHGKNVPG